jgi:hypothetical protein
VRSLRQRFFVRDVQGDAAPIAKLFDVGKLVTGDCVRRPPATCSLRSACWIARSTGCGIMAYIAWAEGESAMRAHFGKTFDPGTHRATMCSGGGSQRANPPRVDACPARHDRVVRSLGRHLPTRER